MKSIPFDFVLDELSSLAPYTNPMFGTVAVYIENKIVLALRDKSVSLEDNGVWLATSSEHHKSLQKDFPSMRSIAMFGSGPTGWQVLPADADDFEEAVLKACQFILAEDPRIGKIPKAKMKKAGKAKKKPAKAKPKIKRKSPIKKTKSLKK